jgi:hypothetical protein
VSIRASQGSSQASVTPRLVGQSRCQRRVLSCPVTPSYNALPQVSSGAPGVIRGCFRRTVQVPLQPGAYWALPPQAMRARGIRCLWFIDDCLLDLPSRPLALLARKTVEDLFVRSGLTRTPDKGVWVPTQTLPDHLGVEISTTSATGWIKVPNRRCQEIARSAKDILCQSAKGVRRVL